MQKKIFNATRNEVIYLPSEVFRFTSLYIDQPIRLIGQPGTIFEVDGGSIFVDLNRAAEINDEGEASSLRRNKVTQLTIKKSEVAMLSEIEIVFNRTKASLYFLT